MSQTTCASCFATLSLLAPIVTAGLGSRVAARCAGLFLLVHRPLPATPTESVRLGVATAETLGTLGHFGLLDSPSPGVVVDWYQFKQS
jgi:transcriptional regulator GlxA family with amidase domain